MNKTEKTDLNGYGCGIQITSHSLKSDNSAANNRAFMLINKVRTGRLLTVAIIGLLAFFLYGCTKKSDDGSSIYTVNFYWTPAGSSTQQEPLAESCKFKCNDNTTIPGCNIFYFLDEPHTSGSGEWMAFPDNKQPVRNSLRG